MKNYDNNHPEVIFGNNVRKFRLAKKMSQEELAFRSDLHRNYLSDVERGTRNISIRAMNQIAEGLGLDLSDLLEGD